MISDIAPEMITEWEGRYGKPVTWAHHQPVSGYDYDGIKSSQKNGRAHDITMYIENRGRLAVIAKPIYPRGLFRAPSGGLNPGEELEIGALREAHEETGLAITLDKYLLRAHVKFEDYGREIHWWTHVFTASTTDELIAPTDTHEIREARWALPEEFAQFNAMMVNAERGGLRYRAALHTQIAQLHPLFKS